MFGFPLFGVIANNNSIAAISGLGALTKINTLILSHNLITEIAGISTLKNLTKLSLAHCQIRVIPDLRVHQLLEELRLNDNKINVVPETIDRNPALKVRRRTRVPAGPQGHSLTHLYMCAVQVLDLGKNRLHDIGDVFRISQCR